jgi:hypothetical protein
VARFVKMRSGSVDDQALRMVGATLELPALGTCSASGATAPGDAVVLEAVQPEHDLLTPRAVELLNVGALAIDANGAHTMLEARALPDIVDLVTGVFYSAHASNPEMDALPSRGGYVVRASGSSPAADAEHGLPSFSVAATAPGEPSDLRIGGQDARTEAGLVLDAKAPVELAWSVGDADEADPTDVVYVDLISAVDEPSKSHAAAVRCVFPDHGLASIPASAFVVDGGVEELRHGTLVVHRVHREVFQVPGRGPGQIGIDSGVVRFDFARAADFTRR